MKLTTTLVSALFVLLSLSANQLYAEESSKIEEVKVAQADSSTKPDSKKEEAEPECD